MPCVQYAQGDTFFFLIFWNITSFYGVFSRQCNEPILEEMKAEKMTSLALGNLILADFHLLHHDIPFVNLRRLRAARLGGTFLLHCTMTDLYHGFLIPSSQPR